MKTEEQTLTEWVADAIKFKAYLPTGDPVIPIVEGDTYTRDEFTIMCSYLLHKMLLNERKMISSNASVFHIDLKKSLLASGWSMPKIGEFFSARKMARFSEAMEVWEYLESQITKRVGKP